ncbi:MAG: hypothetical protein HC857_05280 [Synechococcales cyanobacterium RU_4_20]|nr:hypothetical protein [Synechococcales cyanobacterium RU_4_20]NJR68929.1 hypothetical protein [Synechococcales cyanobacterium CRU_2_2]
MHLPPLHPPFSDRYHVSGEVAIALDAVIAPGVVLMADPSSTIVVGSGVCLGLGVVLHAHRGSIVIGAGASLGAGVLVVGNCRIGTQACIGASTTLHNASVAPSQLVPPGSLLSRRATTSGGEASDRFRNGVGNTSGQPAGSTSRQTQGAASPQGVEPSPWDSPPADSPESARSESARSEPSQSKAPRMGQENQNDAVTPSESFPQQPPAPPRSPQKVYGKEQFERMRILFMPD